MINKSVPLKDIQSNFKTSMLQTAHAFKDGASEWNDVFQSNEISAQERLSVYHNNILGSLSAHLRSVYPTTLSLVGDDFFKNMASHFIINAPPNKACLIEYGAEFSAFIKAFKPAKTLPYLPDIAALEWAQHRAYHAEDETPLTAADLNNIPPEALPSIILHPAQSATLISSRFPILEIQRFCSDQDGETPDISKPYNTKLLIHRRELETTATEMQDDEYVFSTELFKNKTLGSALEETLEKHPNFNVSAFLHKHIKIGTFTKISAPNE